MRNKDGNQDVLYNRDYNMLDVINYSFAKISGGKLSVSGLTNLNNVLTLRQKGIRVVIVVDGVSNDTANAFNIMSASPISRKVFINSVMEVIDLYQLDGLDLDWEINVNTTNFNLLCKELREAFDKYNRKLILSAAVGVATNAFDARTLANYLDYLHIMTYGMGSTSRVTHETALYSGSGVTYSVDYAVNKYSSQGFPKSKMTFGIQFYVRMGTVSGNPVNPFGLPMTSARSIGYASFLSNYFNANQQYQYFDPNTSSYYWYDGTTYASYDNQQSVKLKCQYAENQGLAGVMYWDYGHDLTGTLLSAIYQEFNN
jgi:chitinase